MYNEHHSSFYLLCSTSDHSVSASNACSLHDKLNDRDPKTNKRKFYETK